MSSPIITPAGPLLLDGGATQHFTADQPVTWTTPRGTLSGVGPTAADWRAPNETGARTVSATNGADPPTVVSISVRALLPEFWEFEQDLVLAKPVLAFQPSYGPKQFRGFGSGAPGRGWAIANSDEDVDSFLALRAFWAYHYPGIPFDVIDPLLDERRTYVATAKLEWKYINNTSVAWNTQIAEVAPFGLVGD